MPCSNARQSDASTAAENYRRLRGSDAKLLYDLICTNIGASTVYLHVLDCYCAAIPGTDTVTIFEETTLLMPSLQHTTWDSGTPCRFTTTDTLPPNISEGTTYYLHDNISPTEGVSYSIHGNLKDALNGTNAITFALGASGTHTIHVLDWVGPTPLQITAGSTGALSFPTGRPYEGGVVAIASTAKDSITLPGAAQTTFEATYST